MNEGYMALMVSILRKVTVEQAFMILDGKNPSTKIKPRTWTQADFREIEQYRSQGYSWNDIGEMFGVAGNTVNTAYKRYVRNGYKVADKAGKPSKYTESDFREVKRLRSEGVTWKEIAKKYGVKSSTIFTIYHNHLMKEGDCNVM